MRVEVIIPWHGGCPHRERALRYVRARHSHPVTIAEGGEPWIKADALIPAIAASEAETVIIADADCWTDGLDEAVEVVEAGAPWAIPHRGVFRLTAEATARVLAGATLDERQDVEQAPYLGWEGGGFIVARPETLLDVPPDPRFVGWGCEDECWALALNLLAGHRHRVKAPLFHLYHPPQRRMDRRKGSPANWSLLRRYTAARLDPEAMRNLIEESRCSPS